jgi:hypothetical protein
LQYWALLNKTALRSCESTFNASPGVKQAPGQHSGVEQLVARPGNTGKVTGSIPVFASR